MSMPRPFNVTVISERYPGGGELAAAIVGILYGSEGNSGIKPTLVPASTFSKYRLALSQAGVARDLAIPIPVSVNLLNPKQIDLWLALDQKGEDVARRMIEKDGPAPSSFYRHLFPEPVVPWGVPVPDPPRDDKFDAWLDLLTKLGVPWSNRIWDAFSKSS